MGADLTRLLVLGGGLILTIIGVSLLGTGEDGGAGLYPLFFGLALIVASVIERVRYRSEEAERSIAAPGPGGGEPIDAELDPRFRATDERFIDPTTGVRMRVWLDPVRGERRYRVEE
jgi:hypothetical protein